MTFFGFTITRKPDPSTAAKALSDLAHGPARARKAETTAQLRREVAAGIVRPLGPHWSRRGG